MGLHAGKCDGGHGHPAVEGQERVQIWHMHPDGFWAVCEVLGPDDS